MRTCFEIIPMDQASDLHVLCYLTGRITSPVGGYVITITIFRQHPKRENLARATLSRKPNSLEDRGISGGV
jgi:hypothetical protein